MQSKEQPCHFQRHLTQGLQLTDLMVWAVINGSSWTQTQDHRNRAHIFHVCFNSWNDSLLVMYYTAFRKACHITWSTFEPLPACAMQCNSSQAQMQRFYSITLTADTAKKNESTNMDSKWKRSFPIGNFCVIALLHFLWCVEEKISLKATKMTRIK